MWLFRQETIDGIKTTYGEDDVVKHIAVRQLAQDVKISFRSVDKIIHEHAYAKLSGRWDPMLLTPF